MKLNCVFLSLLSIISSIRAGPIEPPHPLPVGGVPVEIHDHPYHVAILNTKKQIICGGTILTSRWALTAYGCVNSTDPLFIVDGENRFQHSSMPKSKSVNHRRCSKQLDLCLLYVETSFNFSSLKVQPVLLPDVHEETEFIAVNVTGIVRTPGSGYSNLRAATIYRSPYHYCSNSSLLSFLEREKNNTLCFGEAKVSGAACLADLGSGAVAFRIKKGPSKKRMLEAQVVLGVASEVEVFYENRCGLFARYTAVSPHVDWIEKEMATSPAQMALKRRAAQRGK